LLALGQLSEGISEIEGLTFEYFFEGEAVSVARTNGTRTIAKVFKICPEFISLSLGSGLEKQITASNVPIWIRKLVGPYRIARSIRVIPKNPALSEVPVSDGEIRAAPLTLGQDCTGDTFRSYPGIGCQSFFIGELVSVQQHGRSQVGVVLGFADDAVEVSLGHVSNTIKFHHDTISHNISKFVDLFYLTDLADLELFPSITVGMTTFQPLIFGQPCDHIPRTKSFVPADFAPGEPVAVRVNKFNSPSRVCGEVLAVEGDTVYVGTVDGMRYPFQATQCLEICKPDGSFYIVENPSSPLVVAVDDGEQTVKIGRTAIRSLQLGHAVSPNELVQTKSARFPPRSLVSVAMHPGADVVGEVHSMSEDGRCAMVVLREGGTAIPVEIAYVTMLKGVRFVARRSSPTTTGPVTFPSPPTAQEFTRPMRALPADPN
jgi:hypothetical protein